MIYLLFLLRVPVNLALVIISGILSPILPLFATDQEGPLDNESGWGVGPRLPKWLSWFQTPDNSLNGDAQFRAINGINYLGKVKWLIRNPAYGFATKYLTGPYEIKTYGDITIQDNDNAKEGWCFVTVNGLFYFKYVKHIPYTQRCFYVELGWSLLGLVYSLPAKWMCIYLLSVRISGFR